MSQRNQHIIFWIVIYFLWLYMKSYGHLQNTYPVKTLINVFIFILVYYFLKRVQIPRFYEKGKIGLFVLSILASSLFFLGLWATITYSWEQFIEFKPKITDLSWGNFLLETVQFYSPTALLLAWDSFQEHSKEKIRLVQLEKEKVASELKFLKAQINPHFLFNTLNNLYSSVVTKSPKAPDMVLQLSGILDYVLFNSQQANVPLEDEVKTIENYIKLEQIRYGERLQLEFQKRESLSLPVSPLILLSLVENAFKHGASGDIDNPQIKIDIYEKGLSIHCNVWNTKSKYQGELNDEYKEGIGLSNIKRQLNLIYPNRHHLNIEESEVYFSASLIINTVT